MGKRTLIIVLGIIALIAVLAAGYYFASPLFIDNTVDEAFPFDVPDQAQIQAMSEADRSELEDDFMAAVPGEAQMDDLSSADQEAVTDKVMEAAATVMMDKPMDDNMMPAADEWALVAAGQFTGADSFHQGAGSASIYQQGDQRALRFEDFSVTNGPDLHVILTENPAPASRDDVGENYIDLGKLKGNLGNQNYDIPAGTDLSTYKGVVIYCQPFHVVFATAALQ